MNQVRLTLTRGYTLVELMIVTSIVGVLATLAVFGVQKYIAASKAGEAIAMIASIRAAEEQYREETFVYLGTDALDSWHPRATPNRNKMNWAGGTGAASDNMATLGVETASPVYFTYAVAAGTSGENFPTPPTATTDFNFPAPAAEPFFVIVAKGDLDGDGTFSYALSHSLSSEIYVESEGE